MRETGCRNLGVVRVRRHVTTILKPLVCLAAALALMAPTCTTATPIASPPNYQGSVLGGALCNATYQTTGFEPDGAGPYPLFVYLVGTGDDSTGPIPAAVTKAMAERGFVALSAAYDNSWLTWAFGDKANVGNCLFNASEPQSLVANACALPNVNCDLGIATWGHSLGGFLAIKASDFEPGVQASWAAGVGTNVLPYDLAEDRLRLLNGVQEGTGPQDMQAITGASPPGDCAASSTQCLRENGSGWVLVQDEPGITPDHCWFKEGGCLSLNPGPASGFLDPNVELPYTLAANADWVQAMVFSAIQQQSQSPNAK